MKLQFFFIIVFAIALGLAGCKRDEVKVYQVSNEQSSALSQAVQNEIAPPAPNDAVQPQLQFVLPANWREQAPGQMRVASFIVTNAEGETADVGVIPLPAGEDETALVNMWRGQMQLSAQTNATADQTVSVGNDSAKLFDIASEQPLIDGKFRARIFVVELTRGATSWFFKMTGEDAFVASQKQSFLQFLKSVSFVENSAPQNFSQQTADAAENQNSNSNVVNSIWAIPPDWKPMPPSEFLLAEFAISGMDAAKAEVNVAELAGEGGGLLANINRWRGQLGLHPVADADLLTLVNSINAENKIRYVDMVGADSKTGKPLRLIGAIVPSGKQTWFYKLMGDEQIVARQKDAFLKFIKSAKYPDVR